MNFPCVLTIAGSDSGGGAGIQADLKTITVLGAFGMSAITAITAQNTKEIKALQPLSADLVARQIQTVAEDITIHAAKTGMLVNKEIIEAVAQAIKNNKIQPLVVDPVLISKSDRALLAEEAYQSLIHSLFPLATLITPNLPEAQILSGLPIKSNKDRQEACRKLYELGPQAVLIKGGHDNKQEVKDLLFDGSNFHTFTAKRIDTLNTHGTGCTLSAAIATFLAKGLKLPEAITKAKQFITEAIRFSLPVGHGHGPLNPYSAAFQEIKKYNNS